MMTSIALDLYIQSEHLFPIFYEKKPQHGGTRCLNSDLLRPGFPAILGILYVPERHISPHLEAAQGFRLMLLFSDKAYTLTLQLVTHL